VADRKAPYCQSRRDSIKATVSNCSTALWLVCVSACVHLLDVSMSCAKTSKPLQIPFGMWTPAGQRNFVFSGGPCFPGGKVCSFSMHPCDLNSLPLVCLHDKVRRCVDNTVEENSSVFSLILMCLLPSARAHRQ